MAASPPGSASSSEFALANSACVSAAAEASADGSAADVARATHVANASSSEYERASPGSSNDAPQTKESGAVAPQMPEGLPSAAELELTLQRLVRRMAMLIQAEKCVFLLHDRERNQLVARPPALGFTAEQVKAIRLAPDHGLSGAVFSSGQPMLVQDAQHSDIVDQMWAKRLDVRNIISHPLVRETRDEQERITGRVTVGVLHVINKRGGGDFTPEDISLLAIMSRQVTAVIANAQLYLRLTEEKEQLQATLQSLLTGIFMVETSGHVSLINPAARAMFGLDEHSLVGQRYDEAIEQAPIVELIRAAVEDGIEGQKEIEIDLANDQSSENRILQCQTSFVRSQAGGHSSVIGVVAIFNDITAIRNVERMKTAFVSTVSHELRTPLTSIKGFISTLLQDTNDTFDKAMRTEFYGIIDSECDRLQRLIEDLLNVSRIESGRALQMHWTTFEPIPVVEKVLQSQRSFSHKHDLVLKELNVIPEILGDADKFDQILSNLISNAIKYSPGGGEVQVEVGSDKEWLTVAVRDTGIGIPSDKIARVFEKFERVDDKDTRQAGGTGIGLYIVKHLVERHAGHIHVESELGKGSAFIFQIPIRPESALAEIKALDASTLDAKNRDDKTRANTRKASKSTP